VPAWITGLAFTISGSLCLISCKAECRWKVSATLACAMASSTLRSAFLRVRDSHSSLSRLNCSTRPSYFFFVSNFGRGHGPEALKWTFKDEKLHWGGQICYEGLYPDFTRELALEGSDILVNVTNDSWFGMPFEPNQHLYMTFARAIEVRRPLVRSTNTGISTAILANGDVLQKSPLHEEWFGEFVLKYRKNAPQTFFTEVGHWDWAVLLIILGLLVSGAIYYAKSRRA
jgi:apolipoprotein N-acyltransferase